MKRALLLDAGCSFVGTRPVKQGWEPSQPVDCRRSDFSMVADGAGALGGVVLAGMVIGALAGASGFVGGCGFDDEVPSQPDCQIMLPALAIGALAAGGFGYSAVRGYKRNRACADAWDEHARWLADPKTISPPIAVQVDAGVDASSIDAPVIDAALVDAGVADAPFD